MSNPIQGMRIVFDCVKAANDNSTPMNDHEIQQLLNKIVSDEDIRKRYNNFSQGYAAEELFRRVYSLLPWVKLITPLGQEQYPEKSKKEIQVPDYLVTFEAGSSEKTSQILVEAKLVENDKQTFRIPKYKYLVLKKYEIESGLPLLFAIFWRTRMIWTLNSIESFLEKSSEYKISFEQACKNDISAIMGDYTYLFRKRPFRKSCFTSLENTENEYFHLHGVYGNTTYEGLSLDGIKYNDLCSVEPAVLDCAFDFFEIQCTSISESETELIEQLIDHIYAYKLSSLLLGYLSKLYCYENENMYYRENIVVENAFDIVDTVRQKCGGEKFYLLPYDRCTSLDSLIKLQFGAVSRIYSAYYNTKRQSGQKIICSHE